MRSLRSATSLLRLLLLAAASLGPLAPGWGQGPLARVASPAAGCDLVELVHLDPTLRLDIRYATPDNFAGRAVYPEARAFLQRPAAEALLAAQRWLRTKGYGLVVYDAYRPWSVTKLFWDLTPPAQRRFVADPAVGSRHNRGCSVDLGLCELATGRTVEMPSAFDEFTERAYVTYGGGTVTQRAHRDLLREALERDGAFFVLPEEWWHFDYKDFRSYPVLDLPFSALTSPGRPVRTGPERSLCPTPGMPDPWVLWPAAPAPPGPEARPAP